MKHLFGLAWFLYICHELHVLENYLIAMPRKKEKVEKEEGRKMKIKYILERESACRFFQETTDITPSITRKLIYAHIIQLWLEIIWNNHTFEVYLFIDWKNFHIWVLFVELVDIQCIVEYIGVSLAFIQLQITKVFTNFEFAIAVWIYITRARDFLNYRR